MVERGDQRGRGSYPREDAFLVAAHDADSGFDLPDGFAEQVIVQEEDLQ